ncbi:hypothetical protein VTO73DRAFT_8911 [Trametes versicolor]
MSRLGPICQTIQARGRPRPCSTVLVSLFYQSRLSRTGLAVWRTWVDRRKKEDRVARGAQRKSWSRVRWRVADGSRIWAGVSPPLCPLFGFPRVWRSVFGVWRLASSRSRSRGVVFGPVGRGFRFQLTLRVRRAMRACPPFLDTVVDCPMIIPPFNLASCSVFFTPRALFLIYFDCHTPDPLSTHIPCRLFALSSAALLPHRSPTSSAISLPPLCRHPPVDSLKDLPTPYQCHLQPPGYTSSHPHPHHPHLPPSNVLRNALIRSANYARI